MLAEVYPPVKELFYQGDLNVLKRKIFGIVGARHANGYGRRAAIRFAKELSNLGYAVASGLARGIDGAAHYGSLLGKTPTIAVLGSGLDIVYPPEHRGLTQKILERGGLLLSEYEPGTRPDKFRFPMRNRIIAALSQGILVIEARENSGSLITAKCALELGRDVFVLPGPYDDSSFRGGHSLVQEGAKLVQGMEDILDELPLENFGPFEFWESLFKKGGGTMTLEEVFTATHLPLGVILEELEAFKRLGEVVELFPQQYSWISPVRKEYGLKDAASGRPS